MDDSSGDERYSCFHLERPLQITVANEQVRRESRSRRRISRQSDPGMGVLGHMPRQFIGVRMSRRGEDRVGIETCDCPVGADKAAGWSPGSFEPVIQRVVQWGTRVERGKGVMREASVGAKQAAGWRAFLQLKGQSEAGHLAGAMLAASRGMRLIVARIWLEPGEGRHGFPGNPQEEREEESGSSVPASAGGKREADITMVGWALAPGDSRAGTRASTD